ncbi:uncharacterized protein MELLADRAFT_66988 [Melampsora larici-populina 98AG31]|uniref:Uncharacterized protein n=1 Tax=Melampsora larici-populina (strain 98AG31 / pathotype 3-4-7) TaxID=747676 RepID=F4S1D5_MELLP|nr:uncharacterized protein MELLADRAFT_66988 [Melampsora larici-populina 98AG31]EGG01543.1 hypothetical protein MELLADRAFT_66988 [Melampsora larici-populina 98AG31]
MDQTKHPTCEACLYNNKLASTDNPSALPPLKYCKDGCEIKSGSKAGTMCGGCRRKSEQPHHIMSNFQQMPQSNFCQINEVNSRPASQPFLVDDVDPARILAIRSKFQTPQLPISQPASMNASTSLSRHSITPAPAVRQEKQPADNPPQSQSALVGSEQDQAYLHGEATSKRICLDQIWEKNARNTPQSTAIGRHHHQILQNSAGPAPVTKQIAVRLNYNAYNGQKPHPIPDYMHDIDFLHQDWDFKIMQAATKHFQEKLVEIFPRNEELDINQPALPPFDPLFYSLGIGAGELSGEHLKQEIISPTKHHKNQRNIRAATSVASINTSSSISDSNFAAEDNGHLAYPDPKNVFRILHYHQKYINQQFCERFNQHTTGKQFLNSPIIRNSNWSGTISRSVSLAVQRIHQLSGQGFDPLKVSNSVVVAAQEQYDIANTPFSQEVATPLPDGHPAGKNQTITTISWSDALQIQLGIGHQIALFAPSWIWSFEGILPGIDSNIRESRNAICWDNAILTALVKSNTQSIQEATLAPLVFGQWKFLAEVKHNELIGNNRVYHQTSCLLEQFKLAMFVQYDVTIAQKNILNSLQAVFNMGMVKDNKWASTCLQYQDIQWTLDWHAYDGSKLQSAHFEYPIPEDEADSAIDVPIDPIFETHEPTHPKSISAQSEAEHDTA